MRKISIYVKVLRKNVGDKINIINGKGFLFIAEIEENKKKYS
jgi:16S rRNA U1498 N3-methylase RsmE